MAHIVIREKHKSMQKSGWNKKLFPHHGFDVLSMRIKKSYYNAANMPWIAMFEKMSKQNILENALDTI